MRMPAGDSYFVDTNVFLYRFDAQDPVKRRIADECIGALWSSGTGRISWQVIFEFYANVVTKAKLSSSIAREAVEDLLLWNPLPPSDGMLHRAWHWCDSAQLNFWDAMIVAAAEQSGARYLLTEDLQADRQFGTVTVLNPFKQDLSSK
jgi:predicted nucleic acid-binding protein